MKKDRILPIFFFSLTLFLISFIFGYQLMSKKLNPKDISKVNEKETDMSEHSGREILSEESRISPNTFIEERIHYTACDHVVTKVEVVEDEFVNMTRDEYTRYLDENYPNKRIISYSSNKITLGITKNHLCENHYVVGEEDGLIAIFRIGENGERLLEKVFTDYPISLLMEIDQEKIVEGIVVDSEEELSEILENFIS
ncbi:BofC C-terminal domain-containing protein [Tissierella carlieri]|uniref:BofC C-terminal domain-containing protein n=1 Tax=Tissierella carlieri TaxID=689904 RepID=A0ABT1S608_9FIRM|nr:BofC C-terminal domain-containing protein [Tissierella carlieri]MBU5314113.1 BofC C-terminal domain-containing protein [Tissierella carlieri]MCQ4921906.1 BofC C-terminal domain-containing protein [Tissierella carlieri]